MGMFDLLASLLGEDPIAFEASIDQIAQSWVPDTTMPPPPTDAQLMALGIDPAEYAALLASGGLGATLTKLT